MTGISSTALDDNVGFKASETLLGIETTLRSHLRLRLRLIQSL